MASYSTFLNFLKYLKCYKSSAWYLRGEEGKHCWSTSGCKSLSAKLNKVLKDRQYYFKLFKGTLHYNGYTNTLLTTYLVKGVLEGFLNFRYPFTITF